MVASNPPKRFLRFGGSQEYHLFQLIVNVHISDLFFSRNVERRRVLCLQRHLSKFSLSTAIGNSFYDPRVELAIVQSFLVIYDVCDVLVTTPIASLVRSSRNSFMRRNANLPFAGLSSTFSYSLLCYDPDH